MSQYQPPQQPYYSPPGKSVTKVRKSTSHTFHLIMTICTFGVWGLVWGCLILWHKMGPKKKVVTRYQ